MNRLRAFDFPHKALRNILSKFSHQAGSINFNNQQEVVDLQKLVNEMFALLESHLCHEENHTFRHIETKRPGAISFELNDHQRMEALQEELKHQLNAGPTNGHDFYIQACKFQSEYLNHIHHEETITEKLLWELFTDEELIEHRTEIMKSMEPEQLMLWFKHGMPASTMADSIAVLAGFKAAAPPSAFQAALNINKPELSKDKFEVLVLALN
jgi:hypothetical protein